jgi:capsular exopolysaccharide synthesis family protein
MDSAVAANVAVVMAQAGQRVILVDADLRRPSLHTLFDLSQEPGITTMLLGQGDGVDLPLINTEVPGLSLLPSGPQPPNPADILGSNRMHMLLARLKELSDIVILQAPPVTVAVDASVLAVQTDGLLLAVRAGHTRRDRVDQAKSILERYRVRLLGAVMTDAPDRGLLTGY